MGCGYSNCKICLNNCQNRLNNAKIKCEFLTCKTCLCNSDKKTSKKNQVVDETKSIKIKNERREAIAVESTNSVIKQLVNSTVSTALIAGKK